ncbi:MAG: hypothetical protein JWN65_2871, partial [Solirubrobacterales bacterium]|nr:hypothetical protein [Solirubrobacterales bacterium]
HGRSMLSAFLGGAAVSGPAAV